MKQQVILLIVFLIFLLHNSAQTNAQSPILWYKYCAPTRVASGSETGYADNLASALSDITTMAGEGELEEAVWYGANTPAEYAQALFYCRGEGSGVTTAECQACVSKAQLELAACTTRTEAIVWYWECTVRVANRDMRGVVETYPSYLMWSPETYILADDPSIDDAESTLVTEVIVKAVQDTSHGFGIGTVDVTLDTTFYFMAQCSVDLILAVGGPELCSKCLVTNAEIAQRNKNRVLQDTKMVGNLMPSCLILMGYIPIDQSSSGVPKLDNPSTSNSTDLVSSPPPPM